LKAPGSCPICEQPLTPTSVRARDRLVTGDGPFTVLECAACEYGITDPQLSEDELARFYPGEYYEDFYEHTQRESGSRLHRLRDRFRRNSAARRHRQPPFDLSGVAAGAMLDVGCGAGELLEHFAGRGWETYGIDLSAAAVAAAGRRGAKTHQGTLEDQPWEAGRFAVIAFQHSLEHIIDPIDTVRRAAALLAKNGLLVITVPNWSCWQRRFLFRNRWFALDLPRHQQHFSPVALTRIADLLDLEVRSVGTNSTAASTAYSLHYLLAGHWTPGWKLWLSYAAAIPLLPFVLLGDRIGGGDCCYVAMRKRG
jgi:2-polyprenyl-3-methyl-5-hydroxy-6-metoxy-1,4-benzoquinol methylase